jgi:hypothetical protein
MSTYTDDQACIVATVDLGPPEHRRTIPAWAAQDKAVARQQRDVVRNEVRAEVGQGPLISVAVVPGYCGPCQGADATQAPATP